MRRPLILLVVLALFGLGAVVALPDHIEMQESAVKMDWPDRVGDWVKVRNTLPSPLEISILAKDTGFSKAEYTHAQSNIRLDVGIVLSGTDPNNSIHRPERCLVAQGHLDLNRTPMVVPLSDGTRLPVTRLHTRMAREMPTESGVPEMLRLNFLTYYWFVGNSLITNSHYARTFQDISDRLLHGTNQRWAYITVAVALNDTPETRAMATQPDSQVDRWIQDFLATVIPGMLDQSILNASPR